MSIHYCFIQCFTIAYTVTMRGGPNDGNFKGFMIQGRVEADNYPTGTFAKFGTNFKSQCSDNVRLSSVVG